MNDIYEIIGSNTSPYSRKLRAILRYRRLPHVWRVRRMQMEPAVEAVRPQLMPMLRFPGTTEYRVDSTPLAYALEARHPDQRSILPPDPADAFLCHLLEDYADEWCSKMMYLLRWVEEPTARFAARWIVQDWLPDAPPGPRAKTEQMVYERQHGRLGLVSGGPANRAVIEADFRELLRVLGAYLTGTRFLFGSRPSLADFALLGQLSTLVVDPLPQALVREIAPRLEFWVQLLDDASGLEGEWNPALPGAAEARHALLSMAGHSYLPFLTANSRALERGEQQFEISVGGHPYRQAPFGYQGKCHAELRRRWAELPPGSRHLIEPLLAETGCLPHL